MTKRISIRGHGADIFFERSAEKPDEARNLARDERATAMTASSLPDRKTARQTADKNGRREARQIDRHQESKTAFQGASATNEPVGKLSDETRRRLRSLVRREHRVHNTFRYAPEELAAVRDIVYDLEVRWGRRVTRNDVMRAALNWIIEDFRDRREESLLSQLFEEED